MTEQQSTKRDGLWIYTILTVIVFLLVGIISYGAYYAVAAVRPEMVAGVSLAQISFWVSVFIIAAEWVLVATIVRRLRTTGIPLLSLIAPRGDPWRFHLLPTAAVFVILNLITAFFIVSLRLIFGVPVYLDLSLGQRLFLGILVPVSAGFCEELIWRGYVITRLEARGRGPLSAIVLAAVPFALIHGEPLHWIYTFLFAVVAGLYYIRERNLVPLMVIHAVVDLWSSGWFVLGA